MKDKTEQQFKYPGKRAAVDGNTAVILCEQESTDAAGAYPITPSTQMGEFWAAAAAAGHRNISGRPLIFIEPEGEHAAAAVTAGLAMTGLRASNFSSGQGIAYMHESLYAAVGKRLTYVLNIGARAMTKANLNVHAGHDDYHCIDDTGFFQIFARDAQSVADLNIISHRIAELSLTPGAIAQDGFLTTHLIESIKVPERELIEEYLGKPEDMIDTPTPAQRIIYGDTRRRIPELWTVDNPVMAGLVQNQDSYMQSVAAQRPYFFDHIAELAEQAFTVPDDPEAALILIGAGTGIAPFRAFLKGLFRETSDFQGRVLLFHGGRTGMELLYMNDARNDFAQYYDRETFEAIEVFSRRPHWSDTIDWGSAMNERAVELWERLQDAHTHVYLAGLEAIRDELDAVFAKIAGSPDKWELRKAELAAGKRWIELLY